MNPAYLLLAIALVAISLAFSACSGDNMPCLSCGDKSSSSSLVQSSSSETISSSSNNSSSSIGESLCTGFAEGTAREHYGKNKPQFCDVRDGKKYVYVKIGSQTWMAENLNYNANGSKCFGQDGTVWNEETYEDDTITPEEVQANCETYGRLYNWAAAVAVCPSSWHLPSGAEWDALVKFIDPDYVVDEPFAVYNMFNTAVGAKLRIIPGWSRNRSGSKESTDDYGFSALPGGYGFPSGSFSYAGSTSELWSATETEGDVRYAVSRYISHNSNNVSRNNGQKVWLYSVRCVKDISTFP